MAKELCKIKQSLRTEDLRSYMKLVNMPTHLCERCGRVANKKKLLCKPVKLS